MGGRKKPSPLQALRWMVLGLVRQHCPGSEIHIKYIVLVLALSHAAAAKGERASLGFPLQMSG